MGQEVIKPQGSSDPAVSYATCLGMACLSSIRYAQTDTWFQFILINT